MMPYLSPRVPNQGAASQRKCGNLPLSALLCLWLCVMHMKHLGLIEFRSLGIQLGDKQVLPLKHFAHAQPCFMVYAVDWHAVYLSC